MTEKIKNAIKVVNKYLIWSVMYNDSVTEGQAELENSLIFLRDYAEKTSKVWDGVLQEIKYRKDRTPSVTMRIAYSEVIDIIKQELTDTENAEMETENAEMKTENEKERRKMKIAEIKDESLIFDNGHVLKSTHDRDCCEWHWLDFSVMENYNVSTKTGKEINIYEQEFDFTDGVPFKKVEDVGILLMDTDDNKYLICGYGSNNGYYGTNINLEYKDENGNIIFEYDVSECQDISY